MTDVSSPLNARLSTLEFLWSSSCKVTSLFQKNRDLEVIQNQLREKCLNLAKGGSGGVDCSSAFQDSAVCRYCGTPWSEGSYKLRIFPHNYKMKKLKMKLISKQGSLSKYDKHLLGLFNIRKDNVLVKQCLTCKKTLKQGLNKPPPLRKEAEVDNMQASEDSFQEARKKKRKRSKKDRFSGLVSSAVISARASQSFRDSLDDIEGSEVSQFSIISSIPSSETPGQDNSSVMNESKAGLVINQEKPAHKPQANGSVCRLGENNYAQEDSSKNNVGDINGCSILSKNSNELLNPPNINTKKKRSRNRKKKQMKLNASNTFISYGENSFMSNKSGQESYTPQKNIIKLSPLLHIESNTAKGATNYLTPGNKRSAPQQTAEHNVNLKGSHKKKKKKSSISDFLSFCN